MSSIDQQFVEFVVKSLVSNPDGVIVERRIDEKGVLLELTVDPEDLGRVIGKRGATAQSLRTLLRALGTKNDARYNLKIIDNGVGENYHNHDNAPESVADASGEDAPAARPNRAVEAPVEPPAVQREATAAPVAPVDEPSDRVKHMRRDLEDLDD